MPDVPHRMPWFDAFVVSVERLGRSTATAAGWTGRATSRSSWRPSRTERLPVDVWAITSTCGTRNAAAGRRASSTGDEAGERRRLLSAAPYTRVGRPSSLRAASTRCGHDAGHSSRFAATCPRSSATSEPPTSSCGSPAGSDAAFPDER